MIGNDIVDLALAKKESNWQRKGFLEKMFTQKEQLLIKNAKNSEEMVWNLWTRKEAAYKIYNRETGFRGFNPVKLVCFYEDQSKGTVSCEGFLYYTQTFVSKEFIYTIAVLEKEYFKYLEKIDVATKISKINGIPSIFDNVSLVVKPVSISHHGRFWEGVTMLPF
ncbi:MAG: 4'-phosphopantetheinyl transferase superfamily protein [Flavobacterium micromati]|nr:4'-phosphopantetheinyl transferase superfamily protein [Flavobacterium micromati]